MKAKTSNNWSNYENKRKEYSKEIREAKRINYQNFCSEIEATNEASRLYKAYAKSKVCKHLRKRLRKPEGGYTEGDMDKANLLLRTHFPGSRTACANNTEENITKPKQIDWKTARTICTEQEVRWAIMSFDRFKSPGVDGILPAF